MIRQRHSRYLTIVALLLFAASCSRERTAESERSATGPDDTRRLPSSSPSESVPTAQSEQNCARGEPEALLAPEPGGPQPTFNKTGKYTATESVQLDGSTRLTIEHSGCAHYVEEFTFFLNEATDARNAGDWFTRAAELLTIAPFKPEERQGMNSLAEGLRKTAKDHATTPGTVSISESESATVKVEAGGSGTKLTILHDVAL